MTTGKREGGAEQNEQFRDDKFMEIAKCSGWKKMINCNCPVNKT